MDVTTWTQIPRCQWAAMNSSATQPSSSFVNAAQPRKRQWGSRRVSIREKEAVRERAATILHSSGKGSWRPLLRRLHFHFLQQ